MMALHPTRSAPPITVIVCCYKAEKTIGLTLRTLLQQTRPPHEILVIEDGSPDRSLQIVSKAAFGEERIRVIRNITNRGTAYSRQLGLIEARTEAVMFFDADDLADPRLLERLGEALVQDPARLGVGCQAHYFADAGGRGNLGRQSVGPTSEEKALNQYRDNKLMFMAPVTLFWRRDALAVGGYRQRIMPNADGVRYEDYAEDLDLWCRMSDLGSEGRYFVTLQESLFRYRKPPGSLSTRNLRVMQLKMRWIKDCLLRRRRGLAERSLAEFIASRSPLDRFHDRRSDLAAGFYKQAGFSYASGRYLRLACCLLLVAVVSPKLILQKLKTQSVRS